MKLFINQYHDYQVTWEEKLLDELDVFGSITYSELVEGALKPFPALRARLPRGIVHPKTGRLQRALKSTLIDSDNAAYYCWAIRRWFDTRVGCGAMAYRLINQWLPKAYEYPRYPGFSKTPLTDQLTIIHPSAKFKKALVIAPSLAHLSIVQHIAHNRKISLQISHV